MSPSKFIISNYGASNERAYNGDVSWASKSPSKFGNNFDSKRNLEQSSFYPSRDTNYSLGVYSSMISQFNTSKDSIYGQRRDWKWSFTLIISIIISSNYIYFLDLYF